jgi:DegV family protein with EDD domain
MTVGVVTDSSADLAPAVLAELSIVAVPLKVRFGEEEFIDGVDLSPEEFWARLRVSDETPKTTSPSPGDFEQAFARLDAQGASGIVCLTLSSKVSATYQAARVAAENFTGRCPVALVDSLSVSAGLGNLCRAAARRAAQGIDLKKIVFEVEQLRSTVAYYGAVETLEYLRRGGRIGAATALLGNALSIRPLLHFEQGTVEVAGKVRTRQNSFAWIAERLEADYPFESLTAFHADASDADAFVAMLAARVPQQKIDVILMGPVMGTHLGPGTVGVTYFKAARERGASDSGLR